MRLLSILLLTAGFYASAQTAADSTSYESAFDWVERKMTFNYFDPTNQHWWVNRIQSNLDGTVTIKNIAAKHPDKVTEKVYHNRTLYLYDLNPNTISIIDLAADQGRFVKGKIIRVECFQGEQDIQVIKDGKPGSKVGFIHISVPEIYEDSLGGYTERLSQKLKQTIFLNARLYNTNNIEDNITAAFKAFRGKYANEDKTVEIDFEVMDVGLVRFALRKDNKISYGTIGYDVDRKAVYYFLAGNKAYLLRDFTFDPNTNELVLQSEGDRMHLIGRNTILFDMEDLKGTFYRY